MDPLSITASVAGIATACLATAKTLNDLRNTYQDAQMTIAAICSETIVVGATLAKIQGILLSNPQVLTAEIEGIPGSEIQNTFDVALTGCSVIYSCLDVEVQKLRKAASGASDPGWAEKAKFVWKEDRMKELLENLRGQEISITLLISILQTETVADIHRIVSEKKSMDVLENTAIRTRSLKASYPNSKAPESIFEKLDDGKTVFGDDSSPVSPESFEFDDDIVNSKVYRRSLASAQLYRKTLAKNQMRRSTEPDIHPSPNEAPHSPSRGETFQSSIRPRLQQVATAMSSTMALRRCSPSTMGLWAQGSYRKFRTSELRFEVIFETPVLFTAPPSNTRGPIAGQPIYYIDGTPDSYKATHVLDPDSHNAADKQALDRIHTADDERASWVMLLSLLQNEERVSRQWDLSNTRSSRDHKKIPDYSLSVGLQSKTRSWDFMPANVTRPYATTAICHLVEIAAILGMHWKKFDSSLWDLRAEGNGMLLQTSNVDGLGVMAVFSITGRSQFHENRVIPTLYIKELCFGSVPSIYDDDEYLEKHKDAHGLGLMFGSLAVDEDTLESLGCSIETRHRWRRDHTHIFSVSFELIGMLGKVFRLRGSNFRMLPNPTMDPWVKKPRPGGPSHWKIGNLLRVFENKVKGLSKKTGITESTKIINRCWESLVLSELDEFKLPLIKRELFHDTVDEMTQHLLSLKQSEVLSVLVWHIERVAAHLEDQKSLINTISFTSMDSAEVLMNYYFDIIRPEVISCKSDGDIKMLSDTEKEQRNGIWLALMFRMLCWLMLHDFDSTDINLVDSDLKGSRMPIYIG